MSDERKNKVRMFEKDKEKIKEKDNGKIKSVIQSSCCKISR